MGRPLGSWKGEANPKWKGGIRRASGYIFILKPGHPNVNKNGYVRQHVFVMSEHIGRPIAKHEVVHHINGVKDDNRIENLVLMKRSEHHSHHHKGVIKEASIKNLRGMTSDEMKRIWDTTMKHKRAKPKVCEHCGSEFYRRGKPKHPHTYCSRSCYFKAQ